MSIDSDFHLKSSLGKQIVYYQWISDLCHNIVKATLEQLLSEVVEDSFLYKMCVVGLCGRP